MKSPQVKFWPPLKQELDALKHAVHNQFSHGNWARGGSSGSTLETNWLNALDQEFDETLSPALLDRLAQTPLSEIGRKWLEDLDEEFDNEIPPMMFDRILRQARGNG